jgi:hypothetical protein
MTGYEMINPLYPQDFEDRADTGVCPYAGELCKGLINQAPTGYLQLHKAVGSAHPTTLSPSVIARLDRTIQKADWESVLLLSNESLLSESVV